MKRRCPVHPKAGNGGMKLVNVLLIVIQLAVTLVVGIYFYRQLKQQKSAQPTVRRESNRELR